MALDTPLLTFWGWEVLGSPSPCGPSPVLAALCLPWQEKCAHVGALRAVGSGGLCAGSGRAVCWGGQGCAGSGQGRLLGVGGAVCWEWAGRRPPGESPHLQVVPSEAAGGTRKGLGSWGRVGLA